MTFDSKPARAIVGLALPLLLINGMLPPEAERRSGTLVGSQPSLLYVCSSIHGQHAAYVDHGELENELGRMLGQDLRRVVRYVWNRTTDLTASMPCDIAFGRSQANGPELGPGRAYRSRLVFVTLRTRDLSLQSLTDPRLRSLRIGVHTMERETSDVFMSTLEQLGLTKLQRYSIYSPYSRSGDPRNLFQALLHRDIDVAIAWGPLAEYFSVRTGVPIDIRPAHGPDRSLPIPAAITLRIQPRDEALTSAVNDALTRRMAALDAFLSRPALPKPKSVRKPVVEASSQ